MTYRMTRIGCASALMCGVLGAHASGQAITIEARPSASEYAVDDPIMIDVIASWDDAQIGTLPGVDSALSAIDVRLFISSDLAVENVFFDPMLQADGAWWETDPEGVFLFGSQLPPLLDSIISVENPITIATVQCTAVSVPTFVDLALQGGNMAATVDIYTDLLGFSTFSLSVEDPGVETIGASIFVGGGPCCDEPCNGADLAEPYEELDFSDVIAFLSALQAGEDEADLAAPFGVFDFSDVIAFLELFASGCP